MGTATAPSSLPIKPHPPYSRVRPTPLVYLVARCSFQRSVLALTIPAAFFAAIDNNTIGPSDSLRSDFLNMSRGFAVILLLMCALLNCVVSSHLVFTQAYITPSYVCSRFYLHDPPGQDDESMPHPEIPEEALRKERELAEAKPDVNPWACIVLLVTTVALMGVTAEFVCPVLSCRSARIHADRLQSLPTAG